jgi:hypothetical protein
MTDVSQGVVMAGKWISIEKRLPKWGEVVIVCHKRHRCKKLGVRPATYWVANERGPLFTYGGKNVVEEPVAWMPLPEPPEVK